MWSLSAQTECHCPLVSSVCPQGNMAKLGPVRGSLRTSAGNIREVLVLLWAEGLKPGAILLLLGKRNQHEVTEPRDRGGFLNGWIQLHLNPGLFTSRVDKNSHLTWACLNCLSPLLLKESWHTHSRWPSSSVGCPLHKHYPSLLLGSQNLPSPTELKKLNVCFPASLTAGVHTLPWSVVSKEKIAKD